MTNLSINVNKIAWLRNARDGDIPNLIDMTNKIIDSGCHGITVHPRPDLRHITPKDVAEIKKIIPSSIEFNIEGNPFEQSNKDYPGYMELINFYQPDQATLVPDDTMQKTSDHGFNLSKPNQELEKIIKTLKSFNIRSSIFIDPDIEQLKRAKDIGVDRVELYTGPYAAFFKSQSTKETYRSVIEFANELNLDLNAGHDLNLENLPFLLDCGEIKEVSIGQAYICLLYTSPSPRD